MCIILTCEKFVRPEYEVIDRCFTSNPHGAGIMWCEDGDVVISKGYTTAQDLWQAIENVPNESRLVVHMRIATSGGIDAGTCHPFPVCDDLDILHAPNVECEAAVAHNGIISGMPTDTTKGISDTISFVSSVVLPLYLSGNHKFTKSARRNIKRNAPGNRFALMTCDGEVFRLGAGWETIDKGVYASNDSWRYESLLGSWNLDDWDDLDEWSEYSWSDSSSKGNSKDYYDKYDDFGVADYFPPSFRYLTNHEKEVLFDNFCGDCDERCVCRAYGPCCDDVYDLMWTVSSDIADERKDDALATA